MAKTKKPKDVYKIKVSGFAGKSYEFSAEESVFGHIKFDKNGVSGIMLATGFSRMVSLFTEKDLVYGIKIMRDIVKIYDAYQVLHSNESEDTND